MPEPPRTGAAVIDLIRKGEIVEPEVLDGYLQTVETNLGEIPGQEFAAKLVSAGVLTKFQARAVLQGKHRGFRLGPYRILDQIGAGGMGQVYLAEHAHMKRRVALKVLPPKLAVDKGMVERFYREARAAAALDHPNIVRAHDVACDKGTHFLVMEYIDGKSLAERLAAKGGKLSTGEAVGYVVQVAAGLKHAHDKGVAHRDVKPANLLVDKEGVVKILDMGLARFFEDEKDKLTKNFDAGGMMGTADYVAPEQLIDSSAADHRADIYSLGATLYHLITGQTPFQGSTTAKLVAHQLKAVPPAHTVCDDVPEELSEVIATMMAKSPADRYQSATEVIAALLPHVGTGVDHDGMESGKLPPIAAAAVSHITGAYSPVMLPGQDEDDEEEIEARRKAIRQKKQLAIAALLGAILLGGGVIAALLMLDDAPSPVITENSDDQKKGPPRFSTQGGKVDVPNAFTLAFKIDTGKITNETALFTRDDKFIITAGSDKLVRVWNASDGKAVRKLEGHTNTIRAISLVPDNKRLLSAGQDNTVKLWDINSGKPLHTYKASAPVMGVAALPDGLRFLSAANDGNIWLWDIQTEQVLKRYAQAPFPVYGLAVTRDGRRAVAGTWDPKRNAAKAEELPKLQPVAVWSFDVESGAEVKRVTTDTSVAHLAMSSDGKSAVFGTNAGLKVFEPESGSFRAMNGVSKRTVAAAFTLDGRYILSTGHDNSMTLWDAAANTSVAAEGGLPGPGLGVAISPDGKRAVVVGANGLADVWKLPAMVVPAPPDVTLPRPIATLASAHGMPEDVIFSHDGSRVVGAFQGAKHLLVWDATTGVEVSRLKLPDVVNGSRALALLPGDQLVSCFSGDPAVRVWNLKTSNLLHRLVSDKVTGFVSVATVPDGRVLAAANDKTVRMWNANNQQELAAFDLKVGLHGIAATPDGKYFVVGCADKTVRLWDIAQKRETRKVGIDPVAWRITLSPDAKWAAMGNVGGVLLWNLDTGEARSLTNSPKPIDGIAFSRDGRYIFGGGADNGLYAWETGGRFLGRVIEHTGVIRSVVRSPAGNRLATSSIDNTGIVWQLPDAMAK